MPEFDIRVKSSRTVLRLHENIPQDQVAGLIAQEAEYTLSGATDGAAAKLEVDPVEGGTRWEVYFLVGRTVRPKAVAAPVAATNGADGAAPKRARKAPTGAAPPPPALPPLPAAAPVEAAAESVAEAVPEAAEAVAA